MPITFKTSEWEAFHGPLPKRAPDLLWPASGKAHGLTLPEGSKVIWQPKFDSEMVVIQLPSGWSATAEARSFITARRLCAKKVKAHLEEQIADG